MVLTRHHIVLGVALALGTGACAAPQAPRPARMSVAEPPSAAETDAAERISKRTCSPKWGLLAPGAGQICNGKTGEGIAVASLAAAEAGAVVSYLATGDEDQVPVAGGAAVMFQNTWIYGAVDPILDEQRARRERFVPQDTLRELALAPFNHHVVSRPEVWAGVLGTVGLAVGYSSLRGDIDLGKTRSAPRIFGETLHPVAAWSATGVGAGALFSHVAIGEEVLFRGLLQSSLARNTSEWEAWVWGSLIFGAAHLPNAALQDDPERYITFDAPFVTVVGAYLGLAYMAGDYSMTSPVAVHFWYDFVLSATYLAWGVDEPFMIRWGSPF